MQATAFILLYHCTFKLVLQGTSISKVLLQLKARSALPFLVLLKKNKCSRMKDCHHQKELGHINESCISYECMLPRTAVASVLTCLRQKSVALRALFAHEIKYLRNSRLKVILFRTSEIVIYAMLLRKLCPLSMPPVFIL